MAARNNSNRTGKIESLENRQLFAADLGFASLAANQISVAPADTGNIEIDSESVGREEIKQLQGGRDGNANLTSREQIIPGLEIIKTRPPELLAGDVDRDGEVGFKDFLALSSNFGSEVDAAITDGDLDGDARVEFSDFLILSNNFGVKASNTSAGDHAGIADWEESMI